MGVHYFTNHYKTLEEAFKDYHNKGTPFYSERYPSYPSLVDPEDETKGYVVSGKEYYG